MLKEITLGQYYPADSVIHKMDPRVKLVATLAYIVSLFIADNLIGYLLATVFLLISIIVSKVPIKFMIRGMKSIVFIMAIAAFFNLISVPGRELFSVWRFTITVEGVITAIKMVVRLAFLIMGSSVMTLTTTPNNLTDGLEKLMKPLRVIKVPVHEIAMMMSIALRFIPILMEETDKIMKAQMARGVDFEKGGLIKKAKNMVPLLVPLFISAFRRANDLAMAMEARCYMGGDGRTKMKPLKYQRRDYLAYAFIVLYLACIVVFGRLRLFL